MTRSTISLTGAAIFRHWLVHALCVLNADYLFRVLEKEAYRYLKFLQHQLLESMSCLPDSTSKYGAVGG
jgi:2-polyprenyl-3-methyl-5-hydroxy-6-metoxy-1,4-benzoquinol methylase